MLNSFQILMPDTDATYLHGVIDKPSVSGFNFMEEEIWKSVDFTNGVYEVSNFGNVRKWFDFSFRQPKILLSPQVLKQYLDSRKYWRVGIRIEKGKHATKLVHVLIAKAFIPNPDNKKEVNHIDGNPSNKSLSNLEWNTHSENIKHAWDNKLIKTPIEDRAFNGRLTPKEVMDIYVEKSWEILVQKYGVSKSTIHRIKCGESWKHITGGGNNIDIKRPQPKKKTSDEINS